MKPSNPHPAKFYCPFRDFQRLSPANSLCKKEYLITELYWHFREYHHDGQLLAFIACAFWEDICSNMEPKCE